MLPLWRIVSYVPTDISVSLREMIQSTANKWSSLPSAEKFETLERILTAYFAEKRPKFPHQVEENQVLTLLFRSTLGLEKSWSSNTFSYFRLIGKDKELAPLLWDLIDTHKWQPSRARQVSHIVNQIVRETGKDRVETCREVLRLSGGKVWSPKAVNSIYEAFQVTAFRRSRRARVPKLTSMSEGQKSSYVNLMEAMEEFCREIYADAPVNALEKSDVFLDLDLLARKIWVTSRTQQRDSLKSDLARYKEACRDLGLAVPSKGSLVDLGDAKKAYRNRVFTVHPDRNAGAGAAEQFRAYTSAITIIESYHQRVSTFTQGVLP